MLAVFQVKLNIKNITIVFSRLSTGSSFYSLFKTNLIKDKLSVLILDALWGGLERSNVRGYCGQRGTIYHHWNASITLLYWSCYIGQLYPLL